MTLTELKKSQIESIKIFPSYNLDYDLGYQKGIAMFEPGIVLFRIDTRTDFHQGIVDGYDQTLELYNQFIAEGSINE